MKRNPLLTSNNYKTMKGEKLFNINTLILYMSPFNQNSKGINVCSHASKGCAQSCLAESGFGGMYQTVKNGRLARTEYFLSDRIGFLSQIKDEIARAIKRNKIKGMETIVRLNGTSDIRYEKFNIFEGKNIFELYPEITFYDYTKNHLRFTTELPTNYHLTFSRSETNHEKAMELLNKGFNVAFVFDKIPALYNGFKVINGDLSDARFLDEKNVIVGLKYKKMTGKGANNALAFESGFAIDTTKPVGIEGVLDVKTLKTKVKKQLA